MGAGVRRVVLMVRGKGSLLAAEQKRRQCANLILIKMHIRHAQLFFLHFHLAFVIDVWLSKLVLEEAFVVVPRAFSRPFRQPLQIFYITDWLFAAALCGLGEQRKIQPLDWLAAFDSQIGSDASFIFKARNLVTSRAPEVANPLFTFILQLGIVHECCFGIRRRFLFLLRNQVTGDVLRVFNVQTQAGHYRHIMNLQFMAFIRSLAVLQTDLIVKPLLPVMLRANIFLLIWTIRACALARVMDPADKIIVIRLFANTSEIRSERATLHL